MSERRNTMVCSFERESPRITAIEIHDWFDERFHIPAQEVQMVQIDGPKRQVKGKENRDFGGHTCEN